MLSTRKISLKTGAFATSLLFFWNTFAWGMPQPTAPAGIFSDLKIPSDLASVQESFIPDNAKKFVVYIQDIHTSIEVQKRISELIRLLNFRHGLNSVGYEGNQGRVETGRVFWFPDQKLKQAVGDYFLRNLKLAGPEHAQVYAEKPLELLGLEDLSLYHRNLKLFQNALRTRQEALNGIGQFEKEILKVFYDTASPEAKRLVDAEISFRAGRLQFPAYVKRLAPTGLEKIASLEDVATLERKTRDAVLVRPSEKELYEALNRLKILKNMANLSAVRREVDQFWQEQDKFRELDFLSLARRVSGNKNRSPQFHDFLDDLIQPAIDFYAVCCARDRVLANHLLKELDHTHSTIVVTGGFHTPSILKELKKNNIAYLVLAPRFSEVEKNTEKIYLDSIARFSVSTVRGPTLQNLIQDRVESDRVALSLIQSGKIQSNPKPVLEDLRRLESVSLDAASLGSHSTGILKTSFLIPGRTERLAPKPDLEYFRLDIEEPNVRLRFNQEGEVDRAMRELLYDRAALVKRQEAVKTLIAQLSEKYPGYFGKIVLSFISEPEEAVTLIDEGDKKIVRVDFELLFHPNLLMAGLMEVLSAEYLKPLPNPLPVKLNVFRSVLRNVLSQATQEEKKWLTQRMERAGKRKLKELIEAVWHEKSRWERVGWLDTSQWLALILDAVEESAGAENANEIQNLKGLLAQDAGLLDMKISYPSAYLGWKSNIGKIDRRIREDKLDWAFLAGFSEDLHQLYEFMAKTKRYGLIWAVVNVLKLSEPDSEKAAEKIAGDVFFNLLATLIRDENTGIRMSPEELAEVYIWLSRGFPYVDASSYIKGEETLFAEQADAAMRWAERRYSVKDLLAFLPELESLGTRFTVPKDLLIRLRDSFERLQKTGAKIEAEGAASLGREQNDRSMLYQSVLISGTSREDREEYAEYADREVFRLTPKGAILKLTLGALDTEMRESLFDEGSVDITRRRREMEKLVGKLRELKLNALVDTTPFSFVGVPSQSVRLETAENANTLYVDYFLLPNHASLITGILEVLYGHYLSEYPIPIMVKLFAMLEALDILVKAGKEERRWLAERLAGTRLLDFLAGFWRQGKTEFQKSLNDEGQRNALLEILEENWPAAKDDVNALRQTDPKVLDVLLVSINTLMLVKSQAEEVQSKYASGSLNQEYLAQINSLYLNNVLLYLARKEKLDVLLAVLKLRGDSQQLINDLVVALYASLGFGPEKPVQLTPQQAAGALVSMQRAGLLIDRGGSKFPISTFVSRMSSGLIPGVTQEKVTQVKAAFQSGLSASSGSSLGLTAEARFLLHRPHLLNRVYREQFGRPLFENALISSNSSYVLDASFFPRPGDPRLEETEAFIEKLVHGGSQLAVSYARGTMHERVALKLKKMVPGILTEGYGSRPLRQRHLKELKDPILILSSGISFEFSRYSDWPKRGVIADPQMTGPSGFSVRDFMKLAELVLKSEPLRRQLRNDSRFPFPELTPEILNSVMNLLNELARTAQAQELIAQAA